MKIDVALLKSIYLRPQAIMILLAVATVTGLTTLKLCHKVRPRYSVAALFEAAEMGSKMESDPRESLFSAGGKSSSDVKLDALAYIEFEYLSGNKNANGVTMIDAKDQKSTNLIQVIAEGYTNESIELYLEETLHDLQTRYEDKLESSVQRGKNQLEFLNKEMLSLETFKIQVETAIKQVGPSPVLGAQLMELTRDLTRLKQEYFAQKGALTPDKIHNFRLTSIRAMGGGAPVFPRSKPSVFLAIFVMLGLTMYALLLSHIWRAKKKLPTAPIVTPIAVQGATTGAIVPHQAAPLAAVDSGVEVEKSQFVANISNELRSPLHNIIGMTGILLESPLNDQQNEFMNSIRTSADSLLSLVNDLLTFKRDNTSPSFSEILPFTADGVINSVIENLPYVYDKNKKDITLDISTEFEALTLIGDNRQIEQSLTHLTTNALKFSRKAQVHIRVSVVNTTANALTAHFEIADTGPGIPQPTLERLFKAFEQQDMEPNRRFGGGGIGLAIAQKLVNGMGGKMGVESVVGLGSKFWFTVPLKYTKRTEGDITLVPPAAAYSSHGRPKYRILLAEDNAITQKITVQILEKFGHRVDVASDGNEVLDALRILPYDLILMDCHMPEMDGYEAARLIRTSKTLPQSDIPIIAVTGSTSHFEKARCKSVGMNSFITKPFRQESLLVLIDDVMQDKQRSA